MVGAARLVALMLFLAGIAINLLRFADYRKA
jgi:hypothetical protein